MRRREFLIGSVGALSLRAQAQKLNRVAVMTSFFGTRMPDVRDHGHPAVTKDLNLLDFPEMMADHFGIHNVEVQQMYFPVVTEASYLNEFKGRLQKAKSRVSNICLEFDDSGTPGIISVCSPDAKIRAEAIAKTKEWIDHAAVLGSPNVMVNQSPLKDGKTDYVVESLKTIGQYAKSKGLVVTVENRNRTDPAILADIIRSAGVYSNPDIGNFADEETRQRGLRLLYPLSHGNTHVKLAPDRFDFAKAVAISKEMGFKGIYSIEANKSVAPEPLDAVRIVLAELLKNI